MNLKKKAGLGLAGLVLTGATWFGLKNYLDNNRKQEEYVQQEKSSKWQTIEEFDGFTYLSLDKLTREEVKENLRTPSCSHDEDIYFRDHGIPSPERRKIITEGIYKGQSIGINRRYDENGETKIYSIIDENITNRVLQVEIYPDGSRRIRKISGKSYNEEEFNKIIERYTK